MTSRLLTFLLCIPLLTALSGCNNSPDFNQYIPTSTQGWESESPVVFQIDSIKRAGSYDVTVGVRTSTAFPFQTLFLVVNQSWKNPDWHHNDTIRCAIADKSGEIEGKGIALYQYTFPISTIQLSKGQYGVVRIYHIMEREMLPGISDIGLSIKRAE